MGTLASTSRAARGAWSWRAAGLTLVLLAYLGLTLAVVFRSPVLTLDTHLSHLHLSRRYPSWRPVVKGFVLFGQRGPATLAFLPVFAWLTWRRRSSRPLVMLGTALVLLNLSVGVVKLAVGRVGPLQTHNTHDLFVGGDIFPSGHVSNAVALYGVLAMLAVTHRRIVAAGAVFLTLMVGLGTIYLNTHWFSDVVGGWLAGAVVLLVLPTVSPVVERAVNRVLARLRRRWAPPEPVLAVPPRRVRASDMRPVRVLHPEAGGHTEKVTPVSSDA
jgi:membrane-associated phospholipid phosphatase